MNLYCHELRAQLRSATLWTFATLLIILFFLSVYPAFKDDAELTRQLIDRMPPQVKQAVGLSIGTFLSFLGFYAYIFSYALLNGATQAAAIGLGIMSRESRTKTTDFLLTRPVTRSKIFIAKLGTALTLLLFTNVVLAIGTFLIAKTFGGEEFSLTAFVMIGFVFAMIQLCFLAIGFFASQVVKKIKSVPSLALGITGSFFVLGILQSLTGEEKFRYLSPFRFFDLTKIITDRQYEMKFLLLAGAVTTILLIASYIMYVRRDTRAVE